MGKVNFINKQNLKIARENIGLSSQEICNKLFKSNKNLISEWEEGESLPSWSQVLKLAKLYNVSEFLFFSEDIIEKQKAIPDYRVGANKKNDKSIKKLINFVLTRQKRIEKYVKEEGFAKNKLQGSGENLNSPKKLAKFIIEKLDINTADIIKFSNRRDALRYLIQKAEKQGIFVGKTISHHKIDIEDMRGLFISNDYCPFIIINRKDALSAQIFSLIHELAHFFRRSDAISNIIDFRNSNKSITAEEAFCNKVAAEILLPESDFKNSFYGKSDIDNISLLYKVSKIFVFYRFKELKKIRTEDVYDLEEEIKKETKENLLKKAEKDRLKKGGGNYINAMKDSNGLLFNKIVYANYSKNKMGYVEASKLLLFSPEKI